MVYIKPFCLLGRRRGQKTSVVESLDIKLWTDPRRVEPTFEPSSLVSSVLLRSPDHLANRIADRMASGTCYSPDLRYTATYTHRSTVTQDWVVHGRGSGCFWAPAPHIQVETIPRFRIHVCRSIELLRHVLCRSSGCPRSTREIWCNRHCRTKPRSI